MSVRERFCCFLVGCYAFVLFNKIIYICQMIHIYGIQLRPNRPNGHVGMYFEVGNFFVGPLRSPSHINRLLVHRLQV